MHTSTSSCRGAGLRAAVATAAVLPMLLGPAAPAATIESPSAGPIGGAQLGRGGVVVDRSAPRLPSIQARTWVVADAVTGAVLAAKGAHAPARPASTLKTLLALTMMPRLNPRDHYTATRADANVEGSKVGLVAGRKYLIDDLWYALFLRSGNDAANALGRAGADGSFRRAIRMMQTEASRLQARDTKVVNPSGLDEPKQFSSAYDLALWGRAAVLHSGIRKYSSTVERTFPSKKARNQKQYRIHTTNRLLGFYPGAFGVKTGYTTLARNTLIAAASRNGRTVIVTVMGSNYRTAPQAARLLDWAFGNKSMKPVGYLVNPLGTTAVAANLDRDVAVVPTDNFQRNARRGRRRAGRF